MTASAASGRNLLLAALSLALGLAFAEGLVRAYAAFGGPIGEELATFDPLAMKFTAHGEHGYKQRPNTAYTFGNGSVANSNAMSYRGPLVDPQKPDGVFRIVLLGGSTTRGLGVGDDQTIDSHMRELLAQRLPNRRFEVVNLALGGYDAYQVFERLRTDGLAMEPDLLIVNSGINDVRNARFEDLAIPGPDRRTLIWEDHLAVQRAAQRRGYPAPWTLIKHYCYLARLPGFLLQRLGDQERVDAVLAIEPKLDAVDYFEASLRRIAALAWEIPAPLIFATPASALRDYAPDHTSTISYWTVDAATTQEYRDRLAERMRQYVAELESEGRPVAYLAPQLPAEAFLDDCHLSEAGNRMVAEAFIDAAVPFILAGSDDAGA